MSETMSEQSECMYTLGQIGRAVWPKGDMPHTLIDAILAKPSVGLALMMKYPAPLARVESQDYDFGRLMSRLPSELPVAVSMESKGWFWFGYYHYMSALTMSVHLRCSDLARVCIFMFGEDWQVPLADELYLREEIVRRWCMPDGPTHIPPSIWADVNHLLRQHSAEGEALAHELLRMVAVSDSHPRGAA